MFTFNQQMLHLTRTLASKFSHIFKTSNLLKEVTCNKIQKVLCWKMTCHNLSVYYIINTTYSVMPLKKEQRCSVLVHTRTYTYIYIYESIENWTIIPEKKRYVWQKHFEMVRI